MKKVLLCILDGVGVNDDKYGNAVKNANTPFLDKLFVNYPNSLLEASGEFVGLPDGQMGNSEVGHSNIGAGRIVYQPLGLINSKIKDRTFYSNDKILDIFQHLKKYDGNLHIMGLLSDGGIHSHINHLFALIDMCKNNDISNVYYHIFTDGRDTSPYSGKKFINELEAKIKSTNIGSIATISGRYYAMDRDNNYDRLQKAYDAIVNGKGQSFETALEAWEVNQKSGITDEFIVPAVIQEKGMVRDNDGIIFFNYRPDRLREIGSALTNSSFSGFSKTNFTNLKVLTMMPVSDEVVCTNAFNLENLVNTLGEYVANKGYSQLRIAETEKYAHVTYFFDGGVEKTLPNTKRILINSPKVATYDLCPEMSAYKITDALLEEIKIGKEDMVILNFANGDMVGHTGIYKAAVQAVETVDECLEKIVTSIELNEYTIIITADHGNCEVMLETDGSPNTQHSTNKVPFILLDKNIKLNDGKLADIAPTILDIMNIEIPSEMTGKSLIRCKNE